MKKNFDQDWKFYLGNLPPTDETEGWGGAKAHAYSYGATARSLNDSAWRTLQLPHDFVSEGEYARKQGGNDMQQIPEMESMDSRLFAGGSLEGGIAWYRKHFRVDKRNEDKRFLLHFGGIYRNATIYLNEYYVGHHKNGYSSFSVDITDFIDFENENVLAVRVDATGREGWWYEGGGIYRHVYLEEKEQAYIEPYGFYTAAPEVDYIEKKALVRIRTEVTSRYLEQKDFQVNVKIYNQEEKLVGSDAGTLHIDAWECGTIEQTIFLSNCELWSVDSPFLYRVEAELLCDGVVVDWERSCLGIRHIKFDSDKGFLLNGQKVRIQGLCCHQDHAGVGIAIPDEVVVFRLRQMKTMGMNAYRSAHHMASDEVLDACDRLGVLVLDETRRMSSAKEDIEELRQVIRTGRNHPSVFLWGIGNEEIFCQDCAEMVRGTKTMRMEVKKLDDTRPITSAVVCWNGRERFDNARMYLPVTQYLDVMGFNYCKAAWEDYHRCMPEQPVLITEASSNSGTRGCYCTNEAKGEYYILDPDNEAKCKSGQKAKRKDLAEGEWKYFAELPYLNGIFLWTGMDYRGEPTPLAYPAVYSQFGIFDYCGFPKDNFYYYKSWWQEKEEVLHIFPHWNHPGKTGQPISVYCYGNAEEAELFVNEKSYGRKKLEKNWYLSWSNVVYEPGILKAIGYRDNKQVSEHQVKTTGPAQRLQMEVLNQEQVPRFGTGIIKISILDKEGNIVPTANNPLSFHICGAGTLLGTGNGNPGDHDSEKLPVRNAYHGLCELLIRRTENGPIQITVSADELEAASIELL